MRRMTDRTNGSVHRGIGLAALVVASFGCADAPTGSASPVDVPPVDVTAADAPPVDVTATDAAPTDASPSDALALRDAADVPPIDATAPDVPPPDPCAVDNGGCGDPAIFRCAAVAGAARCRFDHAADHAALTDGVRTINLGSSLASALVVHGDSAFPVVFDDRHATFVAAARAGDGRLVEWGHEGLMDNPRNPTDDRGRLLLNAARWAARGRTVFGVEGSRTELRAFLTEAGFTVRSAGVADLDAVQVFVTDAGVARTPEQATRLRAWVRAGGGLLMGGHAWYWGYSHDNPAENFAGNHVLHDLGLTITTDSDPTNNTAVPVRPPTDLDHAVRALERVRDHVAGTPPLPLADQVLASATVRRAVRVEPIASAYMDRVRALRMALPDVIPTEAAPVRPATQPIPALTVIIDTRIALDTPVASLVAHPAAADFPGALTAPVDAAAVTRALDLSYAGRTARLGGSSDRPVWRSTGLYAAPGARVTVTVPAEVTGRGVDVLVGSWTDDNTGTEAWSRMPVVVRSFALTATETLVGSAFGGLIYVRVPPGATLGMRGVTFRGATAAPRFVLGATSAAEWQAQRALPGLYAELEARGVVLTVPSSRVRTLDDPTALMTFWDSVLDADADLASFPRARPRAERIVFDRQIVAGYMHAGYPIMAFTPQAAEAVDLATLRRDGNWGFFHELGRNHQFADWSWSGTGECTTNLWSLYAMERASGRAPGTGHPAVAPAERARRLTAYVAGGRNFARDWSVWTCLDTFSQLREGFGWELFQRLNAEYLALADAERPADEAARIQRWVVRSSQLAGRNLAPFYAAWGFPVTEGTRALTAALPAWAEDPMR